MKILVYSSLLCPYCFAAKNLLKELNLNYKEILIDNKLEVKNQMTRLSNGLKFFLEINMLVVMMI